MSATCATCGHDSGDHGSFGDTACRCCTCTAYVAPTTGSTDADRARLAEIRAQRTGNGHWGASPTEAADLLRMAEDGIAAREAVERVRALHYDATRDGLSLGGFCRACGHGYPCATIRALDGAETDKGV